MASAVARVYNGGRGRQSPSGVQGRAPGQGIRGQSPLKLKHFWFSDIQWKPQICPLS